MSEKNEQGKLLIRKSIVTGVTTFFSRFFGLAREQTVAYFLGTSAAADAFALAFQLPNLFRRFLAEGAMSAAFIPVFSEYTKKGDNEAASRFASQFFSFMLFLISLVILLFFIFAKPIVIDIFAPGFEDVAGKSEMAVELARLMFPYILLIGLASVMQGILNTHMVFFPSAFTPILLSCSVMSFAFFSGDVFRSPAYALAAGVITGGCLQFLFHVPFVIRQGIKLVPTFRIWGKDIRRAVMLWLPAVFGAGIYQINLLISDRIASQIGTGAISSLTYSTRLNEFVLGVFVVSVSTVVLPILSRLSAQSDYSEMKKVLTGSFRLIAYITIPATVALFILRHDVIHLLFSFKGGAFGENSISITAFAFQFHVLGLLFIAATRITVPAYYSLKDTKTPVKIGVVAVIVNCALCYALAPFLNQGGIALANTISAILHLVLLLVFLPARVKPFPGEIFYSTLKILVASFALGIFCHYASIIHSANFSSSKLVEVVSIIIIVLLGSGLYGLLTFLLKSQELKELIASRKKS